jgi:cell shape-determining protein MreD
MNNSLRAIVLFFSVVLSIMLQMTVFSRISLLHGNLDLVMLSLIAWNLQERGPNMWPWTLLAGGIIAFASAVPFFVSIPAYLAITGLARLIQRRIWQSPLLAMLLVTLLGTLLMHFLTMAALFLNGTSFQFDSAWSQVTVPSLLLNLLMAVPVYAPIRSINDQINPLVVQ